MNNIDKSKLINSIISSSGGKINQKDVKDAAAGDLSGLLGALSAEDRKKLNDTLNDKNAMQSLLSSDAAKKLLALFEGKAKNG